MVSTGQAISHYEIRERLGQGGMGEIYRAKDLTLGRDIAIKVQPEEFSLDRRNEVPFSTMETPSTDSQLRLIRGDMSTMLTLFSDLPPASAGFLRMVAETFQRWFSPLILKFPTCPFMDRKCDY